MRSHTVDRIISVGQAWKKQIGKQDQKPEKELVFEKFQSDIRTRVRHGAP